MSSPIAPCMADICMNWVLNQALNNANLHQPTFLRRYVDDLFCIFNNEAQLDDFFNTLNAIHANIKFTKELEHSRRKWNRSGFSRHDPTGKFQNRRRSIGFSPAWSTVFSRKVFVHSSMHLMKNFQKVSHG